MYLFFVLTMNKPYQKQELFVNRPVGSLPESIIRKDSFSEGLIAIRLHPSFSIFLLTLFLPLWLHVRLLISGDIVGTK